MIIFILSTILTMNFIQKIVSDIAKFHPASCGYLQLLHYGQLLETGEIMKQLFFFLSIQFQ